MYSITNLTMIKRAKKQIGFTLIEVLAAMAVLMVLVLLLMRVFNASTAAMDKGINSALGNSSARAALDMIRRDLEGLVVNKDYAMYKESNCIDAHYDQLLFITTTGPGVDTSDARNLRLVEYYVSHTADTNKGYAPFRLMRREENLAHLNVDITQWPDIEWWRNSSWLLGSGALVLENVVSFDVFVIDDMNRNVWTRGKYDMIFGGDGAYDSLQDSDPNCDGVLASNEPPSAIEIFLQVASEETMKKAGLLLDAYNKGGGMAVKDRAYWLLTKESSIIMTRAVPFLGFAERGHPTEYN